MDTLIKEKKKTYLLYLIHHIFKKEQNKISVKNQSLMHRQIHVNAATIESETVFKTAGAMR